MSLSFSHMSVRARVKGKWSLSNEEKVLFLLVGQDKVELVTVSLFRRISTPEQFQLNRRHNPNRPSLTLLINRTEQMSQELFITQCLFPTRGFRYSLFNQLISNGKFPLGKGLLDTYPEPLGSMGNS